MIYFYLPEEKEILSDGEKRNTSKRGRNKETEEMKFFAEILSRPREEGDPKFGEFVSADFLRTSKTLSISFGVMLNEQQLSGRRLTRF